MTSINPTIQAILDDLNKMAASGDSDGVAAASDYLQKLMNGEQCDCDGCDECDESLDTDLADMIEDAILEDDKDFLIKSLSTALMLTARAAGFSNTSASAHSIWVEQ